MLLILTACHTQKQENSDQTKRFSVKSVSLGLNI